MKSKYFNSAVLIASLLMVVFANLDIANAQGPKQERSAPRFMQQLNDEQKAEMKSMIADMKAAGATREEIHIAVKEKLDEFGVKPPERGDQMDAHGFRGPGHDGPMFHNQLNEEQRTEIREKIDELKNQGASREEIHQTVSEMLKGYGIEPPENGFKGLRPGMHHGMHFPDLNLNEEQREAIRVKIDAMREDGAGREEIHQTVSEMLKGYGIEPPEAFLRQREMMK
jgi:DNA-binding transcriptional regulator YhcF (GntR family)